jgi:recombination DNA repair RAD52 pathway protein
MSFTQNQVRKLRSKLKPQHIKTRATDGITLSYLEGWHVIAEANRIFGFDENGGGKLGHGSGGIVPLRAV